MKAIFKLLAISFSLPIIYSSNLPSFQIEIKRDGERVEMKCTSGCNWKELGFSLTNGTSIVDADGVYTKLSDNGVTDNNFAFKVEAAENGLKFLSVKGTAWKELSYGGNPSKTRYLDERGVSLDKH